MSSVFFYKEFNDRDLGNGESFLRKKFNAIIKDLEENKLTHQGSIKLISSKGGIKYLRAKLSGSDRLLFTSIEHNGKDVFVILEVILNHDYENSRFLKSTDKTKSIEIKETEEGIIEKSSGNVHNVEIKDLERAHWLGKLVTFGATQEDIVKRAEECRLPLIISGAAGSGKTSVALESLKKIQEKFKGGKILYITKSKNLVKESKKLLEYEYYDETTNKYETRVPEEIEFLSVHEFIEKVTKEGAEMRKSVEGKKPINRNAFFSWFNTKCDEGKFRKYKKDRDKIFEELIAVIGGRGLLGKEGKVQYVDLGDRQSIFPKDERCSIYDFFEEYKKFIEGSSEYYDTSLIAYECIKEVQKVYDAVVVDEVQDLTESTLSLVLRSLKDESKGNFLLCGDVNQVIHPSFFSISRLKSFLHENTYTDIACKVCVLEKNYRNSKQVTEVGNRILHLKNYCFASEDKMTADEKEAFFMKSDTENTGNVCFVTKDKEQEMAGKVPGSINWAVLVLDDESKEDARKLFSTPLVFNIHEAKGLEFENVILYKFTSCKAYNEIWKIACTDKSEGEIDNTINRIRDSYNEKKVNTSRNKNKEDKSFEEYKFYINALYVGITRAIDNVYVIDDENNLLKIIEPQEKSNVNIKKEESSPEEWRDMALKLIDEGNIEQAKDIVKKLLYEEKKEYTQEIMLALKAKEHHTQELQLPLDKSDQAISGLKIESTTPQKSPVGKSRIPAKNSGQKKGIAKLGTNKTQQDQNGDQEKYKRLLYIILHDQVIQFKKMLKKMDISQYDKERMVNVALESGTLKVAKYLIEQGVDVDASYGEGFTRLHFSAQEGQNDVVELLLKHGAKVNAEDKEGCTSLHLAAQNGHYDVVKLLLQHKADVNFKARELTPLHVAAGGGHYHVVELLLQHEADVNAKGTGTKIEGLTPLHVSAQNDHTSVVELLLQHKADIDAKNIHGFTALHLAATEGYAGTVKLLLDYGADVNAKGTQNSTPLHTAATEGHTGTVKLLLDYGADVNAKAANDTSLLLALENSHSEVVDLLLADPNINVGCIKIGCMSCKNKKDKEKFLQKLDQDNKLFKKVEEAAREVDENKVDELLKETEKLLQSKSKYGFKPSLNYSPDGSDENTTIKIAIKAGWKILQLLYDYAGENMDKNTEIFKQLKHAKENPQPRSGFNDVSTPHNLAQAQVSIT